MISRRIQVRTRNLSYLNRSVRKRLSINLVEDNGNVVLLGSAYMHRERPEWKVYNYVLMDYFGEDTYFVHDSIDIVPSIINTIPTLRGTLVEFIDDEKQYI